MGEMIELVFQGKDGVGMIIGTTAKSAYYPLAGQASRCDTWRWAISICSRFTSGKAKSLKNRTQICWWNHGADSSFWLRDRRSYWLSAFPIAHP